ncbi:response regulator transcription factor [Baekduia sp. Peel2402]|uniref:response regulator transcription factor n=1 Tax=Baekduia sp. Peel2402 TaxID=3458296 RepID=UPI00403EA8DD
MIEARIRRRTAAASMSASCVRVVIVDDYLPLRQLLREVLVARGCSIVGEASDGDEAIEVVLSTVPDIVVMDAHMPRVGGVEATRAIRDRNADIEVVIFTASDSPLLTREAYEAGATHVFPKTTLGSLVDHVAAS